MTVKSREQKLRRAARRKGLIAMKSRKQHVFGFGAGWMIVDANTNFVVCGGSPIAYSLSLEAAEAYVYE